MRAVRGLILCAGDAGDMMPSLSREGGEKVVGMKFPIIEGESEYSDAAAPPIGLGEPQNEDESMDIVEQVEYPESQLIDRVIAPREDENDAVDVPAIVIIFEEKEEFDASDVRFLRTEEDGFLLFPLREIIETGCDVIHNAPECEISA